MRQLLIIVLTAVCLVGPSAAVLAEEITQTETDKMNADIKAEKKATKAEKKAKKAEMKKLKKQQKKAKKKAMKEKGGTQNDTVQTQGQGGNHSGQDMKPAVPDIPAPQAPGAR